MLINLPGLIQKVSLFVTFYFTYYTLAVPTVLITGQVCHKKLAGVYVKVTLTLAKIPLIRNWEATGLYIGMGSNIPLVR